MKWICCNSDVFYNLENVKIINFARKDCYDDEHFLWIIEIDGDRRCSIKVKDESEEDETMESMYQDFLDFLRDERIIFNLPH